jgi:hypothetical protein
MELQYLVGLCCLRRNPEAVKIVLGDMVHDDAAGKARDVDVTITLDELDGTRRAFKAIEVKKEAKALDVATVEQLCMKFNDMPDITHRAVVSAAGFTDGALRKAERHGVELYSFVSWQDLGKTFHPGAERPLHKWPCSSIEHCSTGLSPRRCALPLWVVPRHSR